MSKFALTVENLTKIYTGSKKQKQNKALNDLTITEKKYKTYSNILLYINLMAFYKSFINCFSRYLRKYNVYLIK